MIGSLRGKVDLIGDDHAILDIGGVGYIVYLTTDHLTSLQVGHEAKIFTNMHVREDALTLYGFKSLEHKEWFLILQSVQGVGSKMALNILSAMEPATVSQSIMAEDVAAFKQVSGVGPKLAARIVNELKNKDKLLTATAFKANKSLGVKQGTNDNNVFNDAISALVSLGFDRRNAFLTVSEILDEDKDIALEDVIRIALAKMGRG
jgi:Holliday junction DNA helicase RuvA